MYGRFKWLDKNLWPCGEVIYLFTLGMTFWLFLFAVLLNIFKCKIQLPMIAINSCKFHGSIKMLNYMRKTSFFRLCVHHIIINSFRLSGGALQCKPDEPPQHDRRSDRGLLRVLGGLGRPQRRRPRWRHHRRAHVDQLRSHGKVWNRKSFRRLPKSTGKSFLLYTF